VSAAPQVESLAGVIGQFEAEVPRHDGVPSGERAVGAFPYQPHRHCHLQLQTTKSDVLTVTQDQTALYSFHYEAILRRCINYYRINVEVI